MKYSVTNKLWEWICDSIKLYFAPALGAIKGADRAYNAEIARQEAKRKTKY